VQRFNGYSESAESGSRYAATVLELGMVDVKERESAMSTGCEILRHLI